MADLYMNKNELQFISQVCASILNDELASENKQVIQTLSEKVNKRLKPTCSTEVYI